MCKVINLAEKREEKRNNLSYVEELELQYKEFFANVDYEKWINGDGDLNESR